MAETEEKKSSIKFNDSWTMKTLGSFIATVLGIALTFGVSKINENKNAKELQKQCVYNVLTDIDNVIMYIKKDSVTVAEIGEWLPDYALKYANKEDFPKDTAVNMIWGLTSAPSYFKNQYHAVGPDIINNIVPTNANDMMVHRLIALAYQRIDTIQKVSDDINEHLDKVLETIVQLGYSRKEYKDDEIVDICFTDKDFLQFCNTVAQICNADAYGFYINSLENYKRRIFNASGITEEDYKSFMENSPTNN